MAKLKSISKAARELNYTQPAISAQIRDLEDTLNTKLLEKEGRKIHLSEAGRIMLPYAERLLRDYAMIIASIPKEMDPKKSFLRIGASSLPGVHLVPNILAGFLKENTDVYFSFIIEKANRIEKMIFDHQIDVGFIGRKREHSAPSAFNEILIKKDELVAVLSAQHPLSVRESISVEELLQIPLIMPQRDVLTRRCVEERFHQSGHSVHIAFEVSNTEAIKRMIGHNLGVTILPRSAVKQEIEAGWLRAVPVAKLELYRYVYLVSRKTKSLDPHLQAFLDYTKARVQERIV